MAITKTRILAVAARLVPFGLALFSILVAACNNGSGGGGGTGY
jgi:predicted small secreted protein